jgi:hypothetical protein
MYPSIRLSDDFQFTLSLSGEIRPGYHPGPNETDPVRFETLNVHAHQETGLVLHRPLDNPGQVLPSIRASHIPNARGQIENPPLR